MKLLPSLLLLLLLGALICEPAAADRAVVLVVRADSDIDTIDLLDVRKVYLGFSVRTSRNEQIRAASNVTAREIYEIFLQGVMGMSVSTYDRRLLTLTLQSGRRRPDIYHNSDELMEALNRDANLISFMWQEEAELSGNLKILRVLWRE